MLPLAFFRFGQVPVVLIRRASAFGIIRPVVVRIDFDFRDLRAQCYTRAGKTIGAGIGKIKKEHSETKKINVPYNNSE